MTSIKVETLKNFIISQLKSVGIDYNIMFQQDNDTGGFVYVICTDYAMGMFSDTVEKNTEMYILNNRLYNWGKDEGLSEDQMLDLKLYMKINDVSEFISYLSTQLLKPIE